MLKFPLIVGYIVAGAILGPSVTGLINTQQIKSLEIINVVALSFIGFGIGGELRWSKIKKMGSIIISVLFFESLGAFVLVSTILSLVLGSIPKGLIFGVLAIATAPAATVEVIRQYKAKGQFTTTLYAIVGLDDVIGLLLFFIVFPIAIIFLGETGAGEKLNILPALGNAGLEILISVGYGVLIGFILDRVMKFVHERSLILLTTLGVVLINCGLAEYLALSPILVNMSMGIVIINSNAIQARKIFNTLGDWTPAVYVWFFTLVGARLNIHLLANFATIAIIYIIARILGKWVGCFLGGKASHAPTTISKYLGLCLGDQAGVAVGLAMVASHKLAKIGMLDFSNQVISTITATTFIAMLVGPIFLKHALFKSGNAKVEQ